MGLNVMFNSMLSSVVTLVMLFGFVLIAMAMPPLKKSNEELKAKIAARKKRLHLDDGY